MVTGNTSLEIDEDDEDIYGDLGDCSFRTGLSNSMVSTIISSSEKDYNYKTNDEYNSIKGSSELLENIDLEVSFEDMSDVLTTTASSFTLASTIDSYTNKTIKSGFCINQDIMHQKNCQEIQKIEPNTASSLWFQKDGSHNVCINLSCVTKFYS